MQPIARLGRRGIYTIPGSPAPTILLVPVVAPNAVTRVFLDAVGVLLAQFGVVHNTDDCPALVDAHDLIVLSAGAAAKEVVPVQLADPPELHICALPPDEAASTLLRSAHCASCGIVLATTTLKVGMALASSTVVTPVSAAAPRSIAHALSADAAADSAHAAELVLHLVDQAAAWAAPRCHLCAGPGARDARVGKRPVQPARRGSWRRGARG